MKVEFVRWKCRIQLRISVGAEIRTWVSRCAQLPVSQDSISFKILIFYFAETKFCWNWNEKFIFLRKSFQNISSLSLSLLLKHSGIPSRQNCWTFSLDNYLWQKEGFLKTNWPFYFQFLKLLKLTFNIVLF